MASKQISGLRTVAVSNVVSVSDVIFSFLVAAVTGSSVMIAQGLQGLADLVTTLFILLGVKLSKKGPTKTHPFGYGREIFFWVLISSLFAFIFSGGLAITNAIRQIIEGTPVDSVYIALLALSFGVLTNGYSLSNSLRRMSQKSNGRSILKYIRESSLVETKMTLLVDLMGTLSAIFGLVALSLYQITGNIIFDGVGALIIGLMTASGSLFVIIDLHDLIVGRSPSHHTIEEIYASAIKVPGVLAVLDLRATSVGSGEILVILEIHFKDNLSTDEIEQITDKIKSDVSKAVPSIKHIQVEAETPEI